MKKSRQRITVFYKYYIKLCNYIDYYKFLAQEKLSSVIKGEKG